jgi:hypothetical protein
MEDSFDLSCSVAARYLAIQVTSSAGVRILNTALALSALVGVKVADSALRLRLHKRTET